ncbi:anti-sigma factor domain-containing protein [Actinomycetospora termitidis]|uniref:Anti-sigma factor n=1 Tax=Actinomycetospora termitidis TaxID=3053470 RepID=A0ABT7M1M2_9PSEU|nr:anti-sigma factor [Actinomycetospora sp. Odt1-22]MDL5154550.1 anti-sigma factor [Actinomycetospora sp. Odt1-22]
MSAEEIPHDGELAGAVVGRALHALEPDEEARVAEHLRTCGPCRALLAETRATMAALAHAVADVDPPASLRRRILDAAAADPAPPPVERTAAPEPEPVAPAPVAPDHGTRPFPVPLPRRRSAALLALIAVVAGVIVLSARGMATGPAADERSVAAARADQVITSAQERNPDVRHAALIQPGGVVMAVVLDDAGGARVVPVDLPDLGPGRTFVLWRVAGGGATAVGTFDGTGTYTPTGTASPAPPGSGLVRGAYAVSAEPTGPVPPRPSAVVASGPLV